MPKELNYDVENIRFELNERIEYLKKRISAGEKNWSSEYAEFVKGRLGAYRAVIGIIESL